MAYGPPQSAYTTQVPPTLVASGGAGGLSFGNDLTIAAAGRITALKYYRSPSATNASRTINVWETTVPNTLLATATTSGDTGEGWKTAALAAPVAVTAGQVVRLSIDVPSSGDSIVRGSFPQPDVINGDLSISGTLGSWTGNAATYPATAGTRNYFADVVFEAEIATALSVAVSEVAGKWAVRLVASGASGTVTWVRDESGKQTPVGTGADVVDRMAPLNTQLYYVATDDTATVVSQPITVASTHPVLSSSMYGSTRQVTIISQQPNSWRARSVWHPVLDRTDGPVVSIFEAEWREGVMILALADRDERHDLIDMLMQGDPLILRSTCPQRVDDLTVLPLDWSDPYVVEGQWDSGQRLHIRYQSVTSEPPAYVPPPAWTYDDVRTVHATYTEVLNTYASYQDLLAKVPK